MSQKYIARQRHDYSNGAIGWAPGGPFDCIGPFAKVQNCPVIVDGKEFCRLTCYATGYPDTWFSVPACTRYRGQHITGYFTTVDVQTENGWESGIEFHIHDRCKAKFSAILP